MKTTCYLFLCAVLLCANTTSAQSTLVEPTLFGLSATVGVSFLNGNPPDGLKSFATPAAGISATWALPMSGDWHLVELIGLESRALGLQATNSEQPTQIIRTIGIGLQSYVGWKSLLLGASITLPVLGYQKMNPDKFIITTEQSPDPIGEMNSGVSFFENQNIIVDLRLGVMIPVFTKMDKRLDITAIASYSLTNMLSQDYYAVPTGSTAVFNPVKESKIPMIQIGISYFLIPPPTYEENPLN